MTMMRTAAYTYGCLDFNKNFFCHPNTGDRGAINVFIFISIRDKQMTYNSLTTLISFFINGMFSNLLPSKLQNISIDLINPKNYINSIYFYARSL